MSGQARRYLVVGPSWVGDMVMAQSLFISLKQQHPDCSIDVVAPLWSLPVLQRMPEVDNGHGLPVSHGKFSLPTRYRSGRALRANEYTHAIVLPRSWKSALVPFFAGAGVRTGYRGEMRYGLLNDIRPLDKDVLTQTVQRYVALGEAVMSGHAPAIPQPHLRVDDNNRDRLLASLQLDLQRPVVCMMPGAEYGPAKQWPVEYYKQLAEKLLAAGYQVWVLGSNKETGLGEDITRQMEHAYNLCGKTELVDVIDLLSCAEQVVSNDSGLMHVAAAVGIKLNVIYGSSTPAYTPPLADAARATVFYRALACSPCFERECPLGHTDCLRGITPDEVYASMLKARVVPAGN